MKYLPLAASVAVVVDFLRLPLEELLLEQLFWQGAGWIAIAGASVTGFGAVTEPVDAADEDFPWLSVLGFVSVFSIFSKSFSKELISELIEFIRHFCGIVEPVALIDSNSTHSSINVWYWDRIASSLSALDWLASSSSSWSTCNGGFLTENCRFGFLAGGSVSIAPAAFDVGVTTVGGSNRSSFLRHSPTVSPLWFIMSDNVRTASTAVFIWNSFTFSGISVEPWISAWVDLLSFHSSYFTIALMLVPLGCLVISRNQCTYVCYMVAMFHSAAVPIESGFIVSKNCFKIGYMWDQCLPSVLEQCPHHQTQLS